MAKLKRQVRRTKEILSANTAAPLSVEELHGGQDFRATMTRNEFEALAGAVVTAGHACYDAQQIGYLTLVCPA